MKKKLLTILLIMSFSITFAGCNLEELGFLNTLRMMSSLTEFTFDGSTTLKINKYEPNESYIEPPLIYEIVEADSDKISFLQKASLLENSLPGDLSPINSLSKVIDEDTIFTTGEQILMYYGSINKSQKKIILNIDTKNPNETISSIIKLIVNDKTLYVDKAFLDSGEIDYVDEETIDGVEYGKFNIDEIFNETMKDCFDIMRDNMYDAPMGIAEVDAMSNSMDYVNGYTDGFYTGEQDGYFDTETLYVETGVADQDLGYTAGYTAGVISGKADKVKYDQEILNIDNMQDELVAKDISATSIIDTLTDSDQPVLEEIINTLFADFSLSLVKKDGNSKYVIDMDTNSIIDAISNTGLFMMDNESLIKTTLKSIVTNISDEDYESIFNDSTSREELNGLIDEISFPKGEDLITEKKYIQDLAELNKASFNSTVDFNFLYSLEKVGSVSYDTSSTISVKSKENTEIPISFDIQLTSVMSINKALNGDVKVAQSLATNGQTSAKIKLDVTDENFVETGILVSKNEDFSNPSMVPAIKQDDGTYVADLSGLDPNAKYFYKSYTKDGSGNLVFSMEVKTFNTLMATSPATGDTSSPWPIVIFIGAAVAILAVLFLMKKKK